MKQPVNPRQKKLQSVSRKIAMFIVQETYTDEGELQLTLARALKMIDDVGKQLAENDAKAEAAENKEQTPE